MFQDFSGNSHPWRGGERQVADLPLHEVQLLWALRRLALMQPIGAARCHAVQAALHRDFGDAGLGIEHLLRCWLARRSQRRLALGAPACALLLPDEAGLLLALRLAGRDADAAEAALVALAGYESAALLPLLTGLAALVGAGG